jgi:hypothetical protein
MAIVPIGEPILIVTTAEDDYSLSVEALDRLGQFAAAAVQYEKVLKLSDSAASASGRGYSPDAVRERLAQLRQALGTPAQAVK